jgi:sulfate transport system ATP-binding protein
VKPEVLLLDEPFGALDPKVREELRRWLRRLHDKLHVTSVLVTHDQSEALEISDRIVVMNQGRLEQVGAPAQLLDQPANAFVDEFMGDVNSLSGVVHDGEARIGGRHSALRTSAPGFAESERVRVLVRPYDLAVVPDSEGEASVERVSVLGDRVKVVVHLEGVGSLVALVLRASEGSGNLEGLVRGGKASVEIRYARVYASDGMPPQLRGAF